MTKLNSEKIGYQKYKRKYIMQLHRDQNLKKNHKPTSASLLLKGCNFARNISTYLKASIRRLVVRAPEVTASFILTNKMDNPIHNYKLQL